MKTVSYILIGGAALGGLYFVAKAMQPAAPTDIGSISSAASSIAGSLFGWLKSKPATGEDPASNDSADTVSSARVSPQSLARYDNGGSVTAWSSLGDAAISDGAGYSRLSGRAQAPSRKLTKAQSAQLGIIPGSHFSIKR